MLPKFYPDKLGPPKDHIKKFILIVRLINVLHEDVVCYLFPYTVENKASTQYFNLPVGYITNWNVFEREFVTKFVDERTQTTIVLEFQGRKWMAKNMLKILTKDPPF